MFPPRRQRLSDGYSSSPYSRVSVSVNYLNNQYLYDGILNTSDPFAALFGLLPYPWSTMAPAYEIPMRNLSSESLRVVTRGNERFYEDIPEHLIYPELSRGTQRSRPARHTTAQRPNVAENARQPGPSAAHDSNGRSNRLHQGFPRSVMESYGIIPRIRGTRSRTAAEPIRLPRPIQTGDGAEDADVESASQNVTIPDGGWRAWLAVFGGFLNFLMALGIMNSFGTFQAYYTNRFPDAAASAISWVGSTQTFLLFLGGLASGPAYDLVGARPLMMVGSGMVGASFFVNVVCREYWQFLLSQGILFGFGLAITFYPVTSAISTWFDKNRGLALGIAVAGSSVGGIIWPVMIDRVLLMAGEEWMHLSVAIISVPLLTLSCLLVVEKKGLAGRNEHGAVSETSTAGSRNAFFAILEPKFLVVSSACLFIYTGMLIPFMWIPLYAQDSGETPSMANGILAIAYGGSVVRRVGAGALGDRYGRFNILAAASVCTGIITLSWTWMTSLPAMITFAVLYGIFSGGLVPLGSACIAQTTDDLGHLGLRIGVMMAISSVGALGGGPLSGAIKEASGQWASVHAFAAAVTMLGAAILMFARVFFWERRLLAVF